MAGLFLWDIMIDKNLDTSNKYAVDSNRRGIVIRNPRRAEMTEDEAIMLVPGDVSFDSFTNETVNGILGLSGTLIDAGNQQIYVIGTDPVV
jgi:hypothetical protein